MRIVLLAPSKRAASEFVKVTGLEPVAVVTPRSKDAARGVEADAVLRVQGLTSKDDQELSEIVAPCLATAHSGVKVVAATEAALSAAGSELTDSDVGAIEALRALARKIDAWDQIVEWALEDAAEVKGARPAVPQNDNVSISAYLKFCDQLGLTPAGRKALGVKKGDASDKSAKIQSLRGQRKAARA